MKRTLFIALFLLLLAASLSGCMPGDGKNTAANPAGFFTGFWHGLIAIVSLIRGLFQPHIRIYETANSGWWYDLGFFLAIAGLGGGGGAAARRSRR
ncbi:MAG TPA: hypothetical protein DD477_11935 [Spirochaetaceae bacterium]|nr:hypothetical protein [Spirochaetaceae bacterium]HAW84856.1 hypothetical protein [Spirochaetaceae bacterium]HAX38448.1 hypothetical protein [Spirochaetaceae bacterium]HBO41906.1 hypothetical protein [Spirochaetaceae bacterium]HCQ87820.1 hypothetical protein [Spirochaetaceae bacterium]